MIQIKKNLMKKIVKKYNIYMTIKLYINKENFFLINMK